MKQQVSAITGADFRAFMNDPTMWAGVYQDDVVIEVNGVKYGDEADIDPLTIITPTSVVRIIDGDVFEGFNRLHTLQEHFDSWKAGPALILTAEESFVENEVFDSIHRIMTEHGMSPSKDDTVTDALAQALQHYLRSCRPAADSESKPTMPRP